MKRLVEVDVEIFGKLDTVKLSFPVECGQRRFRTASTDDFNWLMSINTRNVMLCFKYAAQQMIKRGGGKITGSSSHLKTPSKNSARSLTRANCTQLCACSMVGGRGRFGFFFGGGTHCCKLNVGFESAAKHLLVRHVKICRPWASAAARLARPPYSGNP